MANEDYRSGVPAPYVTHAEMAPVHQKIGSLEKGQETILETYRHLRGEILTGFESMRREQRDALSAAAENSKQRQAGQIQMTVRELVYLMVAVLAAAAFLSGKTVHWGALLQ